MRRSVIFEVNLLCDEWFMDIDVRNGVVDDTINEYKWANIDRTATDIDYEVVKCKHDGDAKIKATFNYER